MKIQNNYSLKNLNSFGVEASAKYFAEIYSESDLTEILNDHGFIDNEYLTLGGGSNILFTDNFNGLVLHNKIKGISITDEDSDTVIVKAEAGENWNDVVKFCVSNYFGGIENLTLIPGSSGAAPIQNIGAYGQELKDCFYSLDAIELNSGVSRLFSKDDCKFSYRNSIFKQSYKTKFFIKSISLRLSKRPELNLEYRGLKDELQNLGIKHPGLEEVSQAVENIRRKKLPSPSEIGNAGSFFKNPIIGLHQFESIKSKFPEIVANELDKDRVKIFAGWLIEKCGWKGKRIGNVGTSPKHALVIVNYSNATGKEILNFAKNIKKDVQNKFGIPLEFEVNCI